MGRTVGQAKAAKSSPKPKAKPSPSPKAKASTRRKRKDDEEEEDPSVQPNAKAKAPSKRVRRKGAEIRDDPSQQSMASLIRRMGNPFVQNPDGDQSSILGFTRPKDMEDKTAGEPEKKQKTEGQEEAETETDTEEPKKKEEEEAEAVEEETPIPETVVVESPEIPEGKKHEEEEGQSCPKEFESLARGESISFNDIVKVAGSLFNHDRSQCISKVRDFIHQCTDDELSVMQSQCHAHTRLKEHLDFLKSVHGVPDDFDFGAQEGDALEDFAGFIEWLLTQDSGSNADEAIANAADPNPNREDAAVTAVKGQVLETPNEVLDDSNSNHNQNQDLKDAADTVGLFGEDQLSDDKVGSGLVWLGLN